MTNKVLEKSTATNSQLAVNGHYRFRSLDKVRFRNLVIVLLLEILTDPKSIFYLFRVPQEVYHIFSFNSTVFNITHKIKDVEPVLL